MRQLIDTFLFSEPHEADLLFLKFELEQFYVDKWVIQENAYTLQGDHKGLHAQDVLSQERFKPFLDRVVLLSANTLINQNDKREDVNFIRENWQRQLCREYICENFTDDSVVMVSDTDEMIDFTSHYRLNEFKRIVENHKNKPEPVYIGRMRYWYDYDNRCFLPNIRIPIVPVSWVKHVPHILSSVRHNHGITYDAGEKPIAFEYSYVFKQADDVWRKKCTYAHTNFTRESIEIALECNHWPRAKERGESVGDKFDFFEIVELNEDNSPMYVRKHLKEMKTNIVNPNYKENRKKHYETIL
jgi:hypothetical protein